MYVWISSHSAGRRPRVAIAPARHIQFNISCWPLSSIAVSGVLSAKGEEDKYLLAVTPGQKLKFSVMAEQFGSPLDGVQSEITERGATPS